MQASHADSISACEALACLSLSPSAGLNIRDHLLEILKRPFHFRTRSDIILDAVDKGRDGDAAGVGGAAVVFVLPVVFGIGLGSWRFSELLCARELAYLAFVTALVAMAAR